MVEGSLVVGLVTLVCVMVLLWRILIVESSLHERVDDIDSSLGNVVGMMLEKIEHLGSQVPEINMINQNPLAMLLEFFKNNGPPGSQPGKIPGSKFSDGFINTPSPPKGQDGQFIEVEELKNNAPTKEKENTQT